MNTENQTGFLPADERSNRLADQVWLRDFITEPDDRTWDDPQATSMHTAATGARKGTKTAATHLLPADALLAVSEHAHFGAMKYTEDGSDGARNWEQGLPYSVMYAAMLRHLLLWWGGETNDLDDDRPHLSAVGFWALSLLAAELRGEPFEDDRP